MANHDRNQRFFVRINFQAPAELYQGQYSWQADVVDLSLQGLSVKLHGQEPEQLEATKLVRAVIYLAKDTAIQMSLRLAHATDALIGFRCENIDVDSISHLRRLVDLNTGNPWASERELATLVTTN